MALYLGLSACAHPCPLCYMLGLMLHRTGLNKKEKDVTRKSQSSVRLNEVIVHNGDQTLTNSCDKGNPFIRKYNNHSVLNTSGSRGSS